MAKMFCHASVRVYWNYGLPTTMMSIWPANDALSEACEWVERERFEAAKRTTGDKHVQHVTVELHGFHAEETE